MARTPSSSIWAFMCTVRTWGLRLLRLWPLRVRCVSLCEIMLYTIYSYCILDSTFIYRRSLAELGAQQVMYSLAGPLNFRLCLFGEHLFYILGGAFDLECPSVVHRCLHPPWEGCKRIGFDHSHVRQVLIRNSYLCFSAATSSGRSRRHPWLTQSSLQHRSCTRLIGYTHFRCAVFDPSPSLDLIQFPAYD